ncbi:hypothetical protein F5Y13DRAFT_164707 [Hypoxylon sp. FL1857]|nr:hypothetical protein F5Y13DRAFT_164707 [Hypoxylon sp. FL1857]
MSEMLRCLIEGTSETIGLSLAIFVLIVGCCRVSWAPPGSIGNWPFVSVQAVLIGDILISPLMIRM